MLLAMALGVPFELLELQDKASSAAPKDAIGFGWRAPCIWNKISTEPMDKALEPLLKTLDAEMASAAKCGSYSAMTTLQALEAAFLAGAGKPSGGMGYHFAASTELILVLEKGSHQLHERFANSFFAPRPKAKPLGATKQGATVKPIEIAEILARAACPEGGKIIDPFIGSGTHAEGIARAGRTAIVADRDLSTFRDWMPNVFKRDWTELGK